MRAWWYGSVPTGVSQNDIAADLRTRFQDHTAADLRRRQERQIRLVAGSGLVVLLVGVWRVLAG